MRIRPFDSQELPGEAQQALRSLIERRTELLQKRREREQRVLAQRRTEKVVRHAPQPLPPELQPIWDTFVSFLTKLTEDKVGILTNDQYLTVLYIAASLVPQQRVDLDVDTSQTLWEIFLGYVLRLTEDLTGKLTNDQYLTVLLVAAVLSGSGGAYLAKDIEIEPIPGMPGVVDIQGALEWLMANKMGIVTDYTLTGLGTTANPLMVIHIDSGTF